MNEKDYVNILNTIGYEPEDEETFFGLLQQAFIRRSYSMENGGQNNEILEFIGDKALDIAVIKKLTEYYDGGLNDDDEFEMEKHITEGKLTKIKEKLVERSMLAHRIEAMGLQEYLIMGKGDIAQNVQNEESVKEDLFEAIIGAITLDCNWDIDCLDHLTGDVEQQRHILQHSSSSALACHLLDRTPEVDVDDVRTSLLDNLGCFNHTRHIAPVDLDYHRTFLLKNLELTHRTVDAADERIGRNELGIHHVGTELFALKTEANIGHVFHWRKKHCAVGKSNICYFHSAKIRNFTHI